MMRRFRLWMLGGLAAVILSMMGASGAHAASWQDKVNYEGVITCYHNGLDAGGLVDSITLNDFDGSANTLIGNSTSKIVPQVGVVNASMAHTQTHGDAQETNYNYSDGTSISCYELLTSKTALKIPKQTDWNVENRQSTIESIKYSANGGGENQSGGNDVDAFRNSRCIAYPYAIRSMESGEDEIYYSQDLCVSNNSVSLTGSPDPNGYIKFLDVSGGAVKVQVNGKTCTFDITSGTANGCSYSGPDFTKFPVRFVAAVGNFISASMGINPDAASAITRTSVTQAGSEHGNSLNTTSTTSKVYSACGKYESDSASISCSNSAVKNGVSIVLTTGAGLSTEYRKPVVRFMDGANSSTDPAEPNNALINAFSKGSIGNYNAIRFTDEEAYQLYHYYLTDVYGITTPYCADDDSLSGAGSRSARLWWSEENKFATCYFDVAEDSKDDKVWGLYNSADGVHGVGHFGRLMSLQDVIDALNALTSLGTNPGDVITSDVENAEINNIGQLCQSSDIVGVKWALCPALENMTYTASGLDDTISDMLEVDTNLYGMTDDEGRPTGVYITWEIVRNIANAAMVIFLIFIIFSQLTGYGIDNYGIKKTLPRLIVMAILINLSFYICELVIDVSNILGEGLRDLFGSAGNLVQERNGVSYGEGFISTIVSLLLGGTAGVGAVAGTAVTLTLLIPGGKEALAMIIVTLIIALAAIIFAVLLFFAMLGARMILIIGCMAAAPVAFACYILPNTQSVFKLWRKLFEACLIIFPICGAIGGMSYLIKAIVFSLDGVHVWMAVVGMLAPFLPFFILPTLLKSAISALGKVGAGITAMGSSLRSGMSRGRSAAESALQNSGVYKDATRNAQGARARKSNEKYEAAKKRANELLAKQKNGTLTGAEQRELRRTRRRTNTFRTRQNALNSQLLDRQSAEDVEAARITMRPETGDYDNEIMATQLDNILDKIDSGSATREEEVKARALMAQLALQAGGASKLADLTTKYDKATGAVKSERTGASARFVGQYMAQNDKVRGAIENKNRYGGSRIKDIASGVIGDNVGQDDYDKMDAGYLSYLRERRANGKSMSGDMSESAWKNQQIMTNPNYKERTVAQDITQDVLDKDKDFVTQKGGVVTRYAGELGQERINKMAANNTLFGMGDVADGVEKTIKGLASAPASSTEYVDVSGDKTYEVKTSGNRNYVVRDGREINIDVSKLENAGYQTRGDYDKMMAGLKRQEEDAVRIGKGTMKYVNNGIVETFDGYATPAGFDSGATHTVRNGQHIYIDRNNGREWNASTGRYEKY